MRNQKSNKKELLTSGLSLALCGAMFAGSTFAWFTDSDVLTHTLKSGELNVAFTDVNGNDLGGKLEFNSTTDTILQPGTKLKSQPIYVKNLGNLDFNYQFEVVAPTDYNDYFTFVVRDNEENIIDIEDYQQTIVAGSSKHGPFTIEATLSASTPGDGFGNDFNKKLDLEPFTITVNATQTNYEMEELTNKELLGQAENGVITLQSDVVMSQPLKLSNYTIDLNGHILTLKSANNRIEGNSVIKNGVIKFDGVKDTTTQNSTIFTGFSELTLNNIRMEADDYAVNYGVFYLDGSRKLNIENNSILNISNNTSGQGAVFRSETEDGTVNIDNSTLNLKDTTRGFSGGTVNITNSKVNISDVDNGIYSILTVDNSEVNITDYSHRALTVSAGPVEIKNKSKVNFKSTVPGFKGDIMFKRQNFITVDSTSEFSYDKNTKIIIDFKGYNGDGREFIQINK